MKTKSSYTSIFARWLNCSESECERVELEDLAQDAEVVSRRVAKVEPEEAAACEQALDRLAVELHHPAALVVNDLTSRGDDREFSRAPRWRRSVREQGRAHRRFLPVPVGAARLAPSGGRSAARRRRDAANRARLRSTARADAAAAAPALAIAASDAAAAGRRRISLRAVRA